MAKQPHEWKMPKVASGKDRFPASPTANYGDQPNSCSRCIACATVRSVS
jgi:hypothetical protein